MIMNKHLLNLDEVGGIKFIKKTEKHYLIQYASGEAAILNILNDHVIRFYMSPTGKFLDYPIPHNSKDVAKITIKTTSDYGYEAFEQSKIRAHEAQYLIQINNMQIVFDKIKGTMKIHSVKTNKDILIESNSLSYTDNKSLQHIFQRNDEYFFGGGMQNGRYSHKGEIIKIINTYKWDDGGVSSPCPFYWSSYGYGILRNTWQPGTYDFGSKSSDFVITSHDSADFDVFIFINQTPSGILNDYYELTGKPGVMPEYAFYEAHLNAFNRDYWVEVDSETSGAILFEDNLYYKSYKPSEIGDKTGILESLNGNNHNYQFSARAMIDRYKKHDIPLGWFIPNDGYGCGYGQTDSLDGDIENLKKFTEYSLQNGVQVGLWTESNLHPTDPMNPKKGERDLSKEVSIANVVALKCDVAWIGSGYSFGLNAVEDTSNTFIEQTKLGGRPMIITVNGWAGTQRYSGIWSGDQTGGAWEFIRFHIPSYIGTGLSGQPIVGADMDGIYGGGNRNVNIRDYQWKTFTPLQLNMDGWGQVSKTPFSFDNIATSINRAYLKFKSMLMPYNYTLGYESRFGLPMVRAMFLEFPDFSFAYTNDCQYQYMWGPNVLVAPIYNMEELNGDSVRHGIYLPDPNQVWINFLTGQKYQGGKVFNNITASLWQIPIFIKDGSTLPMTNPNNNPFEIQRDNRILTLYPNGTTSFDMYEDDGFTSDYLNGHYAITNITMTGPPSNEHGDLLITINKTTGTYENMTTHRSTLLQIMATSDVESIQMTVNGEFIILNKVECDEDFAEKDNIFYFKTDFTINPYLYDVIDCCDREMIEQKFLLVKIGKIDVTSNIINVTVTNYVNKDVVFFCESNINENLKIPSNLRVDKNRISSSSITIEWEAEADANYYEIERDGTCYTNIPSSFFLFDNFKCETTHYFRIRSVNEYGVSEWSNTVTATTDDDPFKFVVNGVSVTCNRPCQPGQEINNFVFSDHLMWHTIWDDIFGTSTPEENNFLELSFDLGDVYELDKIEYKPRTDAGNGTFLLSQYKFSKNGTEWSETSKPIQFDRDCSVKRIHLNGACFRYFKLKVLDSIGGYGSGNSFLFFKTSK